MKNLACFTVMVASYACGCTNVDVDNTGGNVDIDCDSESANPLLASDAGTDAAVDPPGVVATCDDHLPCTFDIQCTPCSQVPVEIRYIKATCTPDNDLSPFCLDSATGEFLYTGCTHFAVDPTPIGTKNACFPVQWPKDPASVAHTGVCNAFGVCVEQ